MTEEPMKVVVRVRPLGQAETNRIITSVDAGCGGITIYNPQNGRDSQEYTFDHVFNMRATQRDVYQNVGIPALQKVLDGYNATILAYGETGTGKTWTMEGNREIPEYCGIIPNIFDSLFKTTSKDNGAQYLFKISFFEIYNERLRDLLAKDNKLNLCIKDHPNGGVFVDGVSEYYVNSLEEIYYILDIGKRNRVTAATSMNEQSSRSHAIFQVSVIKQETNSTGRKLSVSKLNLVDLAGSECQRKTENRGTRLKESGNINKSLTTLRMIISELGKEKKSNKYIRFRDSKLTRLLQDSLGGNSLTTLIATISPHADSYRENVSTLTFATQSQIVKCVLTDNDKFGHTDSDINQYVQMLNATGKQQNVEEDMPSEQTTMTDEERIHYLELRAAEAEEQYLRALEDKKEKKKNYMTGVKERIREYKERLSEDEDIHQKELQSHLKQIKLIANRKRDLKFLNDFCECSFLIERDIPHSLMKQYPEIFLEEDKAGQQNDNISGVRKRIGEHKRQNLEDEMRNEKGLQDRIKQVPILADRRSKLKLIDGLCESLFPVEKDVPDSLKEIIPDIFKDFKCESVNSNGNVTEHNIHNMNPSMSEEIKAKNPQLSASDRHENGKETLNGRDYANQRLCALNKLNCTAKSSTETKPKTSPEPRKDTEVKIRRTGRNIQKITPTETKSARIQNPQLSANDRNENVKDKLNGRYCANERSLVLKGPDCTGKSSMKTKPNTASQNSHTQTEVTLPCKKQAGMIHESFSKHIPWFRETSKSIDELLGVTCNATNCKCRPNKSPVENLPSVTEEIMSNTPIKNVLCNHQPAKPRVEKNNAPPFSKYENWYKKVSQNVDDLLKISSSGVNSLTAHKHIGYAPF